MNSQPDRYPPFAVDLALQAYAPAPAASPGIVNLAAQHARLQMAG